MESYSILKQKSNIEKKVLKTLNIICADIDNTNELILDILKNLINLLNQTLEYSHEKQQELLGYDFNTTLEEHLFNNSNKPTVPLYFLLDLIIRITNTRYLEQFSRKEEILSTLATLTLIRNKISMLKFNSLFDPNEEISEDIINSIIKSEGNFYLSFDQKYNIEYPLITIYTKDKKESKPLYEKDEKLLMKCYNNTTREKKEKIRIIAEKYFETKSIPFSYLFEYSLIDKNIDERIKKILYAICTIQDKALMKTNELANNSEKLINELEQIEKKIEEEKQQEQKEYDSKKQSTIIEARESYNKKSWLWKLFNKKLNVEQIDLVSMELDEIKTLLRKVK